MTDAYATAGELQQALLHAWETGHGSDDVARPLGLLQAVWPQHDPALWQQASLGQRDSCLFLLQASLFGAQLSTVAACPACGERLESRFDVQDVCALPSHPPPQQAPLCMEQQGYRVSYRLPCSSDLQALALAADDDAQAAVAGLLQRCVLQAEGHGQPIAPSQLPPSLLGCLEQAMAQQDPAADLQLDVACPGCGHRWSAGLDIARYVWGELDDWAQDLLADVDALARHYAWSEHDILALSPVRRRFYLDLVRT
jgi:DNA-directed RNA polymerase subunit RPC12/RpoP